GRHRATGLWPCTTLSNQILRYRFAILGVRGACGRRPTLEPETASAQSPHTAQQAGEFMGRERRVRVNVAGMETSQTLDHGCHRSAALTDGRPNNESVRAMPIRLENPTWSDKESKAPATVGRCLCFDPFVLER